MRAIILSTLAFFIGLTTLSGQITLRNSLSNKTRTLKAEGEIGLGIPIEGQSLDCGFRMLNGTLHDTKKGVVRVLLKGEKKTMAFDNGLAKKEEIFYGNIKGLGPVAYSIADISHLTYRNKGAEGWTNMGGIITTLGALNALVVAPLVSINYGSGEFNSEQYLRWAGYSLGATGVGVTLLLSSKKRHFEIQRPGQAASRKLWIIEQ
ncbi:MAG: hypothetical protein KDD06_26450 [Phaeodactylibacter sp.]|nr:hypothetical protein [Phaeodactylibacter sp.]MCB9265181.1 hypothetical protein [Lewinellaceae bacterium]MCB9285957.1 hypothetical protein [Lewinellaceae bacterium]